MILHRNPARGRVPLLPTLPTLASFPGGVLQSGGLTVPSQTAEFPALTGAGKGKWQPYSSFAGPVPLTGSVTVVSGSPTRTWSISGGGLVANGTPGVDNGVVLQVTPTGYPAINVTIDASLDGEAVATAAEMQAVMDDASTARRSGKTMIVRYNSYSMESFFGANKHVKGASECLWQGENANFRPIIDQIKLVAQNAGVVLGGARFKHLDFFLPQDTARHGLVAPGSPRVVFSTSGQTGGIVEDVIVEDCSLRSNYTPMPQTGRINPWGIEGRMVEQVEGFSAMTGSQRIALRRCEVRNIGYAARWAAPNCFYEDNDCHHIYADFCNIGNGADFLMVRNNRWHQSMCHQSFLHPDAVQFIQGGTGTMEDITIVGNVAIMGDFATLTRPGANYRTSRTVTITASRALLPEEADRTILIDGNGITVTLPPVAAGSGVGTFRIRNKSPLQSNTVVAAGADTGTELPKTIDSTVEWSVRSNNTIWLQGHGLASHQLFPGDNRNWIDVGASDLTHTLPPVAAASGRTFIWRLIGSADRLTIASSDAHTELTFPYLMTRANTFLNMFGLRSNGVTWEPVPLGLRAGMTYVDDDVVLGPGWHDQFLMIDTARKAKNINVALPAWEPDLIFHVQKWDNSDGRSITITRPGGANLYLRGDEIASMVITHPNRSFEIRASATPNRWDLVPHSFTRQSTFGNNNGLKIKRLRIGFCIFLGLSSSGHSIEDVTEDSFVDQCIYLRPILPDSNGDSVIDEGDGVEAGKVQNIRMTGRSGAIGRCVTSGDVNLNYRPDPGGYDAGNPRAFQNRVLALSGNPTLGLYAEMFQGNTEADFNPMTCDDAINTFLVRAGGSLDVATVKVNGTTRTNGGWNWDTGRQNPGSPWMGDTSAPYRFEDHWWNVAGNGNSGEALIQITDLPWWGNSAITRLEYRKKLVGAPSFDAWTVFGSPAPGDYVLSGIANGNYLFEVQAVNSIGSAGSPASAKSATVIAEASFTTSTSGPGFRTTGSAPYDNLPAGQTEITFLADVVPASGTANGTIFCVNGLFLRIEMQDNSRQIRSSLKDSANNVLLSNVTTATNVYTFGNRQKILAAISMTARRLRLFNNGVQIGSDFTWAAGGTDLLAAGSISLNCLNNDTAYDAHTVFRLAAWQVDASDGVVPTGTPLLNVVGDAATVNALPTKRGANAT